MDGMDGAFDHPEAQGRYRVNTNCDACSVNVQLQPSDILLWKVMPGAPLIDRLIGWGERRLGDQVGDAAYFHVAMVGVDPLHYYESKPGGVCNTPVPNPLPSYIEVRRFITPLKEDELKRMWVYANSQIGTGYNYIGVLTGGMIEVLGKPFCSELVWRIATYEGVVICPWKTCLSPDDIAASSLLTLPSQIAPGTLA
jgi:hypothetical protein